MAEQVTLHVQRRTVTGKAVRHLRQEGVLPANIFGANRPSIPIQVSAQELERAFKTHGASSMFRLVVAPQGGEEAVLVRHVQRAPITGAIQHIDFMHIEMKTLMHAHVPIRLTGEAPAVRLHGGLLVRSLDTVEVEALPGDLPQALSVDVSSLDELNMSILVRDIPLPEHVKMLTGADEAVATIIVTRGGLTAEPETAAPAPAPENPPATP